MEWRKLVMGRGLLIGGRKFAELGDGGGDGFERVIDFGFGGVATEAEADAGTGFVGGEADGGENVRRLDGAGRASGTGGNADAFQIERDDEGFAFDSWKREIGCVRRARRVCGVDARIGNARSETVFEFIAQGADACRVLFEREAREFGSLAEAHDAGNVFRAGTETALMVAAVKKLL